MKKVVILLSGGMDSSTLAYEAVHAGEEVHTLGIAYGQRHIRELAAAVDIASKLGVSHQAVDLGGLRVLLASALTRDDREVPEGHYEAESMRDTVVPMRNAIFLSIAVGYAWSLGAEVVRTAIHAGDHAIYPDCRPEFLRAFNAMTRAASEGFVTPQVEAPYLVLTKAQIAERGQRVGVPWEATWSCYNGRSRHCGRCGTCVERREALGPLGDPTLYEDLVLG
jgi:7-cyano-7-deazaguanine synthase